MAIIVSNNVDLIRHLSSDLVERHPIEVDSEQTVDFSARKSCFKNRLAISDGLASRGNIDGLILVSEHV